MVIIVIPSSAMKILQSIGPCGDLMIHHPFVGRFHDHIQNKHFAYAILITFWLSHSTCRYAAALYKWYFLMRY